MKGHATLKVSVYFRYVALTMAAVNIIRAETSNQLAAIFHPLNHPQKLCVFLCFM